MYIFMLLIYKLLLDGGYLKFRTVFLSDNMLQVTKSINFFNLYLILRFLLQTNSSMTYIRKILQLKTWLWVIYLWSYHLHQLSNVWFPSGLHFTLNSVLNWIKMLCNWLLNQLLTTMSKHEHNLNKKSIINPSTATFRNNQQYLHSRTTTFISRSLPSVFVSQVAQTV